MALRLEGKVALVTGAGRGIGRAIAEKMAEEGATVAIAEIDQATGHDAAQAICAEGKSAVFVRADVTDEESVRAAVDTAIDQFGHLDILVNNAGRNFYFDATTMTGDDWDMAMAVDLKGAWLTAKYAIPHMVKQGGGAIINISSVHANMTTYGMFPYAAAKSGLIGLTRSLALDWGAKNIRVVAISPGWVRTFLNEEYFARQPDPAAAEAKAKQSQPLNRIGTPREIANLVAFIASDEASYITGTEITIDGGLSAKFSD